jgi:hypothetical protein
LPSGHPFTNVLGEWYWSSTTNVDHTNTAWTGAMAATMPNKLRLSPSTCGQCVTPIDYLGYLII